MDGNSSPDIQFIDIVLLSYRLGRVRHEEQKQALLAASRAAGDAMSYLAALENLGVGRNTALYKFVGELLSSLSSYRARYAEMIGLRREGESPAPFLGNQRVLYLVEPVLSMKQQKLFYDVFWWFVHNHEASFFSPKKGFLIGTYATEPKDNVSTLQRFEDYLHYCVNHKTQRIRNRFEGFPTDIVIAILRRAFT